MAVSHLNFNDQLNHGRQLRRALQQLEESTEGLADVLAVFVRMIDGDGSDAAHFTYATAKFGFTDNATAKAAYEELSSLNSKFSGNGSVSDVNAAMVQAFAKFR